MVCQNRLAGQIFQLPAPQDCSFHVNLTTDYTHPQRYQLYKQNLIEYQTESWLCKATTQSVKLLTYLFGDEHLKEFGQEDIHVDINTCKSMVNDKQSPAGPLRRTQTGLWTTSHPLSYQTPGGGFQCCRWYHYAVTNYYVVPSKVYKRHDHPGFTSTAADVSHCRSYVDGECQLGDQALIWTPIQQARCKYLPHVILDGIEHGGMWISNDSQLALTHVKGHTTQDCEKTLNISDQGVPYILLGTTPGSEEEFPHGAPLPPQTRTRREATRSQVSLESLLDPDVTIPGFAKLPEGISANIKDGPVSASLLAAWTQGVAYREREMMTRAFRQTWLNSCRDMKATAALLLTFILSSPIGAVRTLLKDPLLYAKAGNGFVEVWKCTPVPTIQLTFHRQTTTCTEEIPIDFTLSDGSNHSGYLDPVNMIINHHGRPVDCQLQPTTPFSLDGELKVYRRRDGQLYPAGNVSGIQALHYHTHEDSHFTDILVPKIYTPVATYSWDELMPTEDTNSLLATAAAQAEIVQLLTAPIHYPAKNKMTEQEADTLAANLVTRGLKKLRHLIGGPFHTWVLLTCMATNIYIVVRLLQKINCWQKTVTRLHRFYRLRRQGHPRPTPRQTTRLHALQDALHRVEDPAQPEAQPPRTPAVIHSQLQIAERVGDNHTAGGECVTELVSG